MYRLGILGLIGLVVYTHVVAGEPAELMSARSQFAERSSPSEADRQAYIHSLAALRSKLAEANNSDAWMAVDAEIRRHPAPEATEAYKKLMVGQWSSPRHEYVYREDGTWSMLPEEEGITNGLWRIEGNQFINSVTIDPDETSRYTIILLNIDDFIITDGETVFYMERIKE
jgi:hypothetical protein